MDSGGLRVELTLELLAVIRIEKRAISWIWRTTTDDDEHYIYAIYLHIYAIALP
jgi:hypothetical protein